MIGCNHLGCLFETLDRDIGLHYLDATSDLNMDKDDLIRRIQRERERTHHYLIVY